MDKPPRWRSWEATVIGPGCPSWVSLWLSPGLRPRPPLLKLTQSPLWAMGHHAQDSLALQRPPPPENASGHTWMYGGIHVFHPCLPWVSSTQNLEAVQVRGQRSQACGATSFPLTLGGVTPALLPCPLREAPWPTPAELLHRSPSLGGPGLAWVLAVGHQH